MDQLLAQRTLSLLHHLMRLVLQLHGSILANIEGLESQVGHRGTTLPPHHPYSSSMAPMDVPLLLPGISTTSTHSTHPSTMASLPHYQPSIMPQNALSAHSHTLLQPNTTASTPEPTLHHHQPHPKQQIPLQHHVDQKHQEPGVTHRTQTILPAITH